MTALGSTRGWIFIALAPNLAVSECFPCQSSVVGIGFALARRCEYELFHVGFREKAQIFAFATNADGAKAPCAGAQLEARHAALTVADRSHLVEAWRRQRHALELLRFRCWFQTLEARPGSWELERPISWFAFGTLGGAGDRIPHVVALVGLRRGRVVSKVNVEVSGGVRDLGVRRCLERRMGRDRQSESGSKANLGAIPHCAFF